MKTAEEKELKRVLKELTQERYVHSLSELTYNGISTLWHLSKESEKDLSSIASRVICGIFCLKYLSHIDALVKKKLNIKELSDIKLSDARENKKIRKRLEGEPELKSLVKEVLPRLREFVESIEPEDLETVTQLAHTGDFLLSSIDDLRGTGDADYSLWLSSVPFYYEKDLRHLNALKPRDIIHEIEKLASRSWKRQIPIEALSLNMKAPNRRINLNTLFTSKEGFFPSTPSAPSAPSAPSTPSAKQASRKKTRRTTSTKRRS